MNWFERLGRPPAAGACAMIGALLSGCARHPYAPPSTQAGEGAYDIVTIASCDSVGPGTFRFEPLASHAHTRPLLVWPWPPPSHALPPQSVYHPRLRRLLGTYTGNPGESLTVLVALIDRVRIPRFPEPRTDLPKTDSLNVDARGRTLDRIRAIIGTRRPAYSADSSFVVRHGGRILERFWITRAIRVRILRDSIGAFGQYREVTYVQPELSNGPPSFCPPEGDNRSDDVIEAIRMIQTEPYRDLGLDFGWVGLLDSGIDDAHPLFGSAKFSGKSDCVTGTDLDCEECCKCLEGSAHDDSPDGHGTSSAALVNAASTDCDGRFRGTTDAQLNVFKVYKWENDLEQLSLPATLRAIQCMSASGDRVLVFETQDCSRDAAAMAVSADNLYDSGAIIIAAAGNLQNSLPEDVANCDSRVGEPGASRRVMAVGAWDILDHDTPSYQSYGGVNGRIKPDVQAPTSTQTAALTEAGTQVFGTFSGTSGATPFGAAVAIYWRNWLASHGKPFDPGQVYALMILSGQTLGPYASTSKTGAGMLVMPTDAECTYAKTDVSWAYPTTDAFVDVDATKDKRIEAAIWWPEQLVFNAELGQMDSHNDVNLEIVDPNGNVVATSASTTGVFERTTTTGALISGRYIVRIHAQTLVASPQTVYYAAVTRRDQSNAAVTARTPP